MAIAKVPSVQRRLRILATSDLHMQMLGRNYATDRKIQHHGFAGLARLIVDARAEADALGAQTLLFDNGDFLQGNALAKHLARTQMSQDHPLALAFNQMRYDAIGLGNHDFDFGFDYLNTVVEQLKMPVVCSNFDLSNIASVHNSLILAIHPGGQAAPLLKLGILSVLPQETNIWNKAVFAGAQSVSSNAQDLRNQAIDLRQQGADLIVLLAHLGPALNAQGESGPSCLLPAVNAVGPDVIVAGHTHDRFPSSDLEKTALIDPDTGTIDGIACVMPGHGASDLGVIDLDLTYTGGRWRVANHRSTLRPNDQTVAPNDDVEIHFAPHDRQVRRELNKVIARTDHAIQNYFSCVAPSITSSWVAQAHHMMANEALKLATIQDLPLLASAPAIAQGHTADATQFDEIPPGALRRLHLEGLDPYGNRPCVVELTASMLKARIEHGCQVFSQLCVDQSRVLLNDSVPPFNFDTFFGVTYEICLSNSPGNRVQNLRYRGNPVMQDQRFLLATTRFRAAGGGGYDTIAEVPLPTLDSAVMETVLQRILNSATPPPWPDLPTWRLTADSGCQAVFTTSVGAAACLDQLTAYTPKVLAPTPDRQMQIQITF